MIFLWVDHSFEILMWNLFYIFFVAFLILCFILRDRPFFGWFWRWIKLIFLGFFITLTANYLKKSFKEWWDK
jgi:drug/metabolite transporter (DMT)-like permease